MPHEEVQEKLNPKFVGQRDLTLDTKFIENHLTEIHYLTRNNPESLPMRISPVCPHVFMYVFMGDTWNCSNFTCQIEPKPENFDKTDRARVGDPNAHLYSESIEVKVS